MPLPPGAPSSSTTTPSSVEQKLKELSALLKKANQDNLPVELQTFVAEETKADSKVETKALHSAVKVLGRARDHLDEALLARANLMSQWRSFLNTSLERFKQYAEHFKYFKAQEKEHQEVITKAREALVQAKEDYHATEEKATTISSDDEPDSKDAAMLDPGVKILEGLDMMTENLQKLTAQADQEIQAEEERKAKRPRGAKDNDGAQAAGQLQSMQPFGMPGQ